ncbi:MAG: type II secretion system inner membrane protein GspF [bacterium]
MPTFKYQAMDPGGQEVSGTIDAASESAASSQLKDQGYRPFEITEQSEGGGFELKIPFLSGPPVSGEELALFTRQLATLLSAGLPLLRSINILEEQQENEDFKKIMNSLSQDIQGGASFSEALGRHPSIFENLYINMVKAGEVGGVLETVLERLAEFAEKNQELKTKIKSATMYPAIMFAIAILVVIFLLIFVLPTFIDLFMDMGVDLPLPTRIVIGVSEFLQTRWYVVFGGVIAAYYALKWYYGTEQGQYNIDKLKISVPIFGELFRKVATARFTRTLATLIRSGVPILQAIEIVQQTIGNRVVSDTMDDVYDSISEGDTISEPLHQSGVFAPMVTHMISVGEETGSLDDMLSRIADNYEMQVDEMVEGLSSMLEPILILFMGVMVGVIVTAMFFPMFQLVSAVG